MVSTETGDLGVVGVLLEGGGGAWVLEDLIMISLGLLLGSLTTLLGTARLATSAAMRLTLGRGVVGDTGVGCLATEEFSLISFLTASAKWV